MENVIIIGSWPAGHTAAIYTGKSWLNPLLFEGFMAGGIAAGGQLTTTTIVENFPGFPHGITGTKLMENAREQSVRAWTRIETQTIDKVDLSSAPFKVRAGDQMRETKALIIATGAAAKRMHIPGEEKYRQRGISACALCDGALPLYRDKHIVVVGGGDVAMEEALHMTHFAAKITILVRRDELRASKVMQDKVLANPKVNVLRNTEVLEATGDALLRGITIINNKTQEKNTLECAWLFYAIGHKPNTDFLAGQLELDESGYIITKPGTTQTSVPGVFAAGDVQDRVYRQAITSAGTGCMAAIEVDKYLHK